MNPFRWSFRTQYLLGFILCAGFIAYALYTQFYQAQEPCPLCIFQRIAFAALGIVFLIGGLHSPAGAIGRGVYGVLVFITAAIGMGISGRHLWIQLMPQDEFTSCGPPLSFMQETMGPMEIVRKVLTGTGNCGDIDWSFLGITMPGWSLIWFVIFGFCTLYISLCSRKPS